MKRLVLLLFACLAGVAAAPHLAGAAGDARKGVCGLPDIAPLWIEEGLQPDTPLNAVLRKPGLILGASTGDFPAQLRADGVNTIYFDLNLVKRIGTPTEPADPATMVDKANRLFDFAATQSGCPTPLIALNELFGASTPTPWTPSTAQYRANVLVFLQTLAARGARPFLLVSSTPYTGGEAGDWWKQVAAVADIVREVYFPAPALYQQGPLLASRTLRTSFRRAVFDFTALDIPTSKLGLMLGFQTSPGNGGRENLQPAQAWFEVTKLQALAARQVAAELKLASVWSWGWGMFNDAERDPDKAAAACVWLWARDSNLCDGPGLAGAGFDASLTEGQLPRDPGTVCTMGTARLRGEAVTALATMTRDRELAFTALFERLVESRRAKISPHDALAAERVIVAQRFHGSRAAYGASLAAKHASLALARAVIADELRRNRIEVTLPVARPSSAAIASYYQTYATLPTRRVEIKPAASWLGGKTSGLALSSVAPQQLFALRPGRKAVLKTADGRFRIRSLGPTMPLGAFTLPDARTAIGAALTGFARDDAFDVWTVKQQRNALGGAICVGDRLPAPGAVELANFLPFLVVAP